MTPDLVFIWLCAHPHDSKEIVSLVIDADHPTEARNKAIQLIDDEERKALNLIQYDADWRLAALNSFRYRIETRWDSANIVVVRNDSRSNTGINWE